MKNSFREALIAHFNAQKSKVVDLERETGVPRSIINKLLRRENKTTNVEDAVALARYYNKSVEEFMSSFRDTDADSY